MLRQLQKKKAIHMITIVILYDVKFVFFTT